MKGGELRRFREEQGWSQDELGRLLKAGLGHWSERPLSSLFGGGDQ